MGALVLARGDAAIRGILDGAERRASDRWQFPNGPGLEAFFVARGRSHRFPCVDIGFYGAALIAAPGSGVEHLKVTDELKDFRVELGGKRVAGVDKATLRRIELLQESQVLTHYCLGVEILSPTADMTFAEPPLSGGERILSLFRRALFRRCPFYIYQVGLKRGILVEDVVLFEDEGRWFLSGRPCLPTGIKCNDTFDLGFEFLGQKYRGRAELVDVSGNELIFALPSSLVPQHRRRHVRLRLQSLEPFYVSFTSPFTSERISRPILDLHASGLSFPFDGLRDLLPRGLVLEDVTILTPAGQTFDCRAEVRSVAALPVIEARSLEATHRCGISLLGISPLSREAIFSGVLTTGSPSIGNGQHYSFASISDLMAEANYKFHPDHVLGYAPHFGTLENAFRKLSASHGDLGVSVVYGADKRPLGHLSSLRIYPRTWLVQHLAVAPGFHRNKQASAELCSCMLDIMETLDDVDWVRFTWNVRNRWSNRMFQKVATAVELEGLTHLRSFRYMRLSPEAATPHVPNPLLVREADSSDLKWIERYFQERQHIVRVKSESLRVEQLELTQLNERFKAHGLFRNRKIFIVEDSNGPVAFALLEKATAGLCMVETTNGVSLFVLDAPPDVALRARLSLISHCTRHYRTSGRLPVLVLGDAEDVPALIGSGFDDLALFSELTVHRSLFRSCKDVYLELFDKIAAAEQQTVRRGELRA